MTTDEATAGEKVKTKDHPGKPYQPVLPKTRKNRNQHVPAEFHPEIKPQRRKNYISMIFCFSAH